MTMLMGDLLTLGQEKLPVKLLVFNNGSLGFVEMEQRVEGLLDAFTELENPDFARLAEVCGLRGWRVDRADRLEDAMRAWLAADGPALLDVRSTGWNWSCRPRSRSRRSLPPPCSASRRCSTGAPAKSSHSCATIF